MERERESDIVVKRWRFNFNPFRPVDCVGGPVYFGRYAVAGVKDDDRMDSLQTPEQVRIKRNMGIIR